MYIPNNITGLTPESNLRDRACALAVAQCVEVLEGHTWLGAYHELEEMGEGEEPQSFDVFEWFKHLTINQLYAQVEDEADVIAYQLQEAFVMGTKFGASQ